MSSDDMTPQASLSEAKLHEKRCADAVRKAKERCQERRADLAEAVVAREKAGIELRKAAKALKEAGEKALAARKACDPA